MPISALPPNLTNVVVTVNPLGKVATGQENTDNKNTTIKPVEQSAKSDRNQLRRRQREDGQEDAIDPDEEHRRVAYLDFEEEDNPDQPATPQMQRLEQKLGLKRDKAKGSIIDGSA